MKYYSISKRYTKAFYELAAKDGKIEQRLEELKAFQQVYDESEQLKAVLESFKATKEDKKKLLAMVCDKLELSTITKNFLLVLVEKNRIAILPEVIDLYHQRQNEEKGIVRASLITPFELVAEVEADVKEKLARLVGKKIELQKEVDPSILGGFIARIGDTLMDFSTKNQLIKMTRHITGGDNAN